MLVRYMLVSKLTRRQHQKSSLTNKKNIKLTEELFGYLLSSRPSDSINSAVHRDSKLLSTLGYFTK